MFAKSNRLRKKKERFPKSYKRVGENNNQLLLKYYIMKDIILLEKGISLDDFAAAIVPLNKKEMNNLQGGWCFKCALALCSPNITINNPIPTDTTTVKPISLPKDTIPSIPNDTIRYMTPNNNYLENDTFINVNTRNSNNCGIAIDANYPII